MTDTRHIIFSEDGRYSTLGRCPPSVEELAAAQVAFIANGLREWHATASNSFHAKRKPVLQMVARINAPLVAFAEAEQLAGGQVAP